MSRRFTGGVKVTAATRIPHAIVIALAVSITGCAAPTNLNFGGDAVASRTPVLLNDGAGSARNDVDGAGSTRNDVADGAGDAGVSRDAGETSGAGNPTDMGSDGATVNDVESAFAKLLAEWVACFHSPEDCAPNPITAPDSPERARLVEAAAYYAGERIRTRPDEGRLEWSIEAVSFTSPDRARVVACEYDTRVFFDSSMADTELGDIIFDTTIWTRRVEWTLARHDGDWKFWSRRIDRRSPVARFCTP